MNHRILSVGLCLFSSLLWATASFGASCGPNTCVGKITTLYPHGGNGKIFIGTDADPTPLNCTLSEGEFLVLKGDNLLHSEIYAMLLAVAISGQEIRLRIEESSPDCELIYTILE